MKGSCFFLTRCWKKKQNSRICPIEIEMPAGFDVSTPKKKCFWHIDALVDQAFLPTPLQSTSERSQEMIIMFKQPMKKMLTSYFG